MSYICTLIILFFLRMRVYAYKRISEGNYETGPLLPLKCGFLYSNSGSRIVLETPLPSESSCWQYSTHLISSAIPPCLSHVNSHSPFPPCISVTRRCRKHLKWVNAQPPATWATAWDQRTNLSVAFLQSRQGTYQLWSSSLGMYVSFQTAENWN